MSSQAGPPPHGGVKEQLGTIFKQISEAQTLDINGDEMVSVGMSMSWFHSQVVELTRVHSKL